MLYLEIVELVKLTPATDSIGNITNIETTRTVLAKKNKVGSKEFYNAVAVGITPTAELQIKLSEYQDEEEANYKGKRYVIVRTVPVGRHDLVIVLGIKNGEKD